MVDGVVTEVQRLQVVRYVQVVSATLMVTEWAMLLSEEIELVWSTKWTPTKVLYLLSRYLPFFDTPLNLIYYLAPKISGKTCTWNYTASTWSTGVGMALSELILIIRTYAIYSQSRRVLMCLGSFWVLIVGGNIGILYIFTKSVRFGKPPVSSIPGCYMVDASPIVFGSFAMLLCLEIVIVVMTLKKGMFHLRHTSNRTQLMSVLYRDGILFFVCLFLLTLGNVIVLLTAPSELLDLLDTFTRVVHSVLCCRILLNIRGAARGSSNHASEGLQEFDRRLSRGMPAFRTPFRGQGSTLESKPLDTVVISLDRWRGPIVDGEDGKEGTFAKTEFRADEAVASVRTTGAV